MPRGLDATQKLAIAARVKMPFYFVSIAFASGTSYVWNGVGDIVTLGATWKGLGEFGIIRGLETDRGLKAGSIVLALAGVPGDYLDPGVIKTSRSERYQGRPVTVYFGTAHPDSGALLSNPIAIWKGVADVLTFRLGAQITAELTCENYASHMRRANGLRMTTESHHARRGSPGTKDLFFDPQTRLMGAPRPALEG